MTLSHPHPFQNYFPSPSHASATSCQTDAEGQAGDVDVPCSGNDERDQASESGKRQRSLEGEDGDEDAKRRVVASGAAVTGTDTTMGADEHTSARTGMDTTTGAVGSRICAVNPSAQEHLCGHVRVVSMAAALAGNIGEFRTRAQQCMDPGCKPEQLHVGEDDQLPDW